MSEAYRESAMHYVRGSASGDQLADVVEESAVDAGVVLREEPLRGHLNLRGDPDDEVFRKSVEEVLKVRLPVEPGCWVPAIDVSVYWLGPNEWLVIVPAGTEADVENQLRQTLHGHFSIVDVSGGQTLINLSGDDVVSVLKKSSVYDFHASHFGQGRCVQTTFAKATALVGKKKDGSFDLVIRRSFTDYLFRWIEDAAREYGLAVERETS